MSDWHSLSIESRSAAWELAEGEHPKFRCAISRAYYAVYSRVTEELLRLNVAMPVGQNNPHHKSLGNLIGYNLTSLEQPVRWRLSGVVRRLYRSRIIADYVPSDDLDKREVSIAFGLMREAFDILEKCT